MLVYENIGECSNFAAPELVISGHECIASFAAAPHGGIASLWFHCRIRNNGGEKLPDVLCVRVKHIQNMLYADQGTFRPVFRSEIQDWQRLPEGTLQIRPDGHSHVEWRVPTPAIGDYLEFAYCYPYAEDELKKLLEDYRDYWTCDEIGVTGKGRPFYRLSNRYGNPNKKDSGLYLIARQHAGEVTGSWILDGFLRKTAELKPDCLVWCIPFLDTDGVLDGNYGKDSFPQDMNRSWGPHVLMRHEVQCTAIDMNHWQERTSLEQSMICDFHSPGGCEDGMYTFIEEGEPAEMKMEEKLNALGKALHPYSHEKFILQMGYKQYSAWGNGYNLEEYAIRKLGRAVFSLETSYISAGGKILEIPDYRMLGGRMAESLFQSLS